MVITTRWEKKIRAREANTEESKEWRWSASDGDARQSSGGEATSFEWGLSLFKNRKKTSHWFAILNLFFFLLFFLARAETKKQNNKQRSTLDATAAPTHNQPPQFFSSLA